MSQDPRPPSRYGTLRAVLLTQAAVGLVFTVVVTAVFGFGGRGIAVAALTEDLQLDPTPHIEWRSIDGLHWQAVSETRLREAPVEGAPGEGTGAGCAAGMLRVKGAFRRELHGEATGEIERIQDAACTDWISRDYPARCRTFDAAKIAAEVAKLPTTPLDFCIDRFEYPNVFGENPIIVVTFHEAEAMCGRSGKRLCSENEWTFACEGEEARPYPYGYVRDANACVIDRTWRPFVEGALEPRNGATARKEVERLWQGEPSGSRASCKSPFGVYDLAGNVDEWTRNVNPTGYASILKGGYWGPVRARCRPATRAHNEDFIDYQQSFRCCSEADTSVPVTRRGAGVTL